MDIIASQGRKIKTPSTSSSTVKPKDFKNWILTTASQPVRTRLFGLCVVDPWPSGAAPGAFYSVFVCVSFVVSLADAVMCSVLWYRGLSNEYVC